VLSLALSRSSVANTRSTPQREREKDGTLNKMLRYNPAIKFTEKKVEFDENGRVKG